MTWWAPIVAVAAVTAWMAAMGRRNRRIARPPVLDPAGRPYPLHDLPLSDGETVTSIDAGSGPAVVLIPGADGTKESWREQIPAFAASYRVLVADSRRRVGREMSFDRLAEDIRELMDSCDVDEAVLVGQSLGGAIALRFASRHPDRTMGLVVANSLARVSYEHVGLNRTLLVPVAQATTRYLPTSLGRWFARVWSRLNVWVFDSSVGSERVIDYVFQSGPRTVPPRVSGGRVDLLAKQDLRPELPSIRAPALVLKGPLDTYTPVAWSREIATLLPRARYAEVEGTGHCSHVSRPELFNRIVLDWLAEIRGPEGSEKEEA